MARKPNATHLILILGLILSACTTSEQGNSSTTKEPGLAIAPDFDLQGHRGCRGLLPENSIPAFRRALELGVNTLELDLVISRDSQVVVSHEPWLSSEICLDLEGKPIAEDSHAEYNLFQMTLDEIQAYDCGSHPHERFPDQQNMPVYKPTLQQVVDSSDAYARQLGRELPFYNVEIKRVPERDGIYHPEAGAFVLLVLNAIEEAGITDRCTVQSFDVESLQLTSQYQPALPLVLLVENEDSPEANLEKLGFVPHAYSPYFELVDEDLVNFCDAQGMKLIPWTVNDSADIHHMIEMGTDGIITDFPDRMPTR